MGKAEEEQGTDDVRAAAERPEGGNEEVCPPCRSIGGILQLRCVASLCFGLAVLLSAVFWLPPFVRSDPGRRAREPEARADILASFILHKPVALLNSNVAKLEYDIFEEIGVPGSLVVVLSLESEHHSNWTNVVFGVTPDAKSSAISTTVLSLLGESFRSLVAQTSTLHLTTPLFGNSSFFQVLKFPGGITIIPPQKAFPLLKAQMLFNFTLNFPIYQVQDKFNELKDQMKSGLLLNSHENLYVRLTNLDGSTVDPPTIVESSVVLAVGNLEPSMPRLKELAQTIRNFSKGNLGLNHTVFGRVKQIRLSSFLQRSLYGETAPSPAPQLSLDHYHHHHHHHPHHQPHHQHSDVHMAPASASSPAPKHNYQAPAPTGCRSGISWKNHFYPAVAPTAPHHHSSADSVPSSAPVTSRPHWPAPWSHEDSHIPAPSPHSLRSSPPATLNFAHAQPPSNSMTEMAPHGMRLISPSPPSSSSFAGRLSIDWVLIPYFLILLL